MSISIPLLPIILMATIALAMSLEANGAVPSVNLNSVNYRLPANVRPTYYTILLLPNMALGTFNGDAIIRIVVSTNETRSITLHSKGLTFDESYTSVVGADRVAVKPFNHTVEQETDFLTLYFSKPGLAAGEYTLNLTFNGLMNDQPEGFYRSWYENEYGQKTWFAATRFAPTNARRAFPCFDEPAFKARFEIQFWTTPEYSVISNMPPLVAVPTSDNVRASRFSVTPVMSTYELAFVISKFESAMSDDDERLRFWSRREVLRKGKYAQSIAEQALESMEDYTNFEYVIPEINNVAIPQSRNGTQANWGLVTYTESDILYDENITTTSAKQNIALTMSRELSKQWFGNMVSPTWWDYTWLNEGLPNFFQYFIANQVETSWRLMDQFVVKNLQETAFVIDGIEGQHPLNARVNSPAEISGLFDAISSSKAGSVIRMFSHALGATVLRTGLREYVKRYAYKTATSDDLFTILASAKGVPPNVNIKGALESWAKLPGYPVVNAVRRYYYRENGIEKQNKDHFFRQARFFATKTATTPTGVWTIPVTFTTEDQLEFENTLPYQWVAGDSPGYYPGVTADKWIIYNKQATGFYRVNYDLTNWRLLAKYLRSAKHEKIHPLNRAQLLDDSFAFVQSGHLSNHQIFLDISSYLVYEDDYIPWYAAFRAFSTLDQSLIHTENYGLFKLYLLKLIGKLEKSVGYSESRGDTHIAKLARVRAINWACKMGSKDCSSATLQKLIDHVDGISKLSADLRQVVMCAGIRTADSATWDKTFAYYQATKNPTERREIVSALGCSADAKILRSYLTKTQNPTNNVALRDVLDAVITGSEAGVDAAMDFIRRNYRKIMLQGETDQSVLAYVNDIGSRMNIEKQTDKLERFINSLIADKPDLSDALTKNALASARSNVAWLETYESPITAFLREQKLTETVE